MNSKISDKDKKDWEDFLSKNEHIPDKDITLKKNNLKKIKSFDFHGYSLSQANKKITYLIHDAYNKKIKKLIIITGKGLHSENEKDPYVSKDLGILKYSLPEYIRNNNELMGMISSIQDADIKDGGAGAFYIFIKSIR